jgi:uncharacterized protein (DUF983 family)
MFCIQWVLLHIPNFLLVVIIAAVYISLSIIGLYVIRVFHSPAKLKLHNDVAGFIFATVGVTYAVLLSFIVSVTWQDFDEARENAYREAHAIVSLYHDTRPLPTAFRSELKRNLVTYVDAIIEDEWLIMIKGEKSAAAEQAQDAIWRLYHGYLPKNETQKIFFAESVNKLNDACDLRKMRLLEAHAAIHPIIYFVLIVGGMITIAFSLFFGTKNFVPHIIMTSLLAAMIAIALSTIVILDFPFTGDISVSSDVFKQALATLVSP